MGVLLAREFQEVLARRSLRSRIGRMQMRLAALREGELRMDLGAGQWVEGPKYCPGYRLEPSVKFQISAIER